MGAVSERPYTAVEDEAIRNHALPYAYIAARLGRSEQAIRGRRRKLATTVPEYEPAGAVAEVGEAERVLLVREEIEALEARVGLAAAELRQLERMLVNKKWQLREMGVTEEPV